MSVETKQLTHADAEAICLLFMITGGAARASDLSDRLGLVRELEHVLERALKPFVDDGRLVFDGSGYAVTVAGQDWMRGMLERVGM
jgi:hypothetical protein